MLFFMNPEKVAHYIVGKGFRIKFWMIWSLMTSEFNFLLFILPAIYFGKGISTA